MFSNQPPLILDMLNFFLLQCSQVAFSSLSQSIYLCQERVILTCANMRVVVPHAPSEQFPLPGIIHFTFQKLQDLYNKVSGFL